MSDLQIGLLVIGAVLVAAVVGYNKLQERRYRRKAEEAFGSPPEDVLLDRAESPRAGHAAASVEAEKVAPRASAEPVEHTIGPAVDPAIKEAAPTVLDERIDFIVDVELPEPVTGLEIDRGVDSVRAGTARNVHWEGLHTEKGVWEAGQTGGRYELVRIGLQTADRRGPAGTDELIAFCAAVQATATDLSGLAECPDPGEAKARADELDRFAAEVDLQIGLNVVRRDGGRIPATKVRSLAEAAGCALEPDGRFVRRDDAGAEVYAVANLEPQPFRAETLRELDTAGISVLLDVPRAPTGTATFRRFVDFARQLEQALDGQIVDDNRRALSEAAFVQIGARLDEVQRQLAARGMPVGGRLALRLFS